MKIQDSGNTATIYCPDVQSGGCGKPFEIPDDPISRKLAKFCDECVARHRQPARPVLHDADKSIIRGKEFNRVVPPYYRADQIRSHMPKGKADEMTARVKLAWTTGDPEASGAEIVTQAGGVFAVGPSGAFKTTCMFNGPIRWLIWKGERVKWVRCSDWRQKLSDAARKGDLIAYLKPYIDARWLFLDDIGQMSGTPTAEEGLKELLEARFSHPKGPLPLMVTTQYDSEALVSKFSDVQLGTAVSRRVLELAGTPIIFQPRKK